MTADEKSELRTAFVLAAYFISLLILGASWWKAAAISLVVIAAYALNMGTGWIVRGTGVLLVVAFAAWLDLVPAPSQMRALATGQFERALAWQCSRQASADQQTAQ